MLDAVVATDNDKYDFNSEILNSSFQVARVFDTWLLFCAFKTDGPFWYAICSTGNLFQRNFGIKRTGCVVFVMNISGILVVVSPQHVAASIASLNTIPGVSVHYTDPGTGRIIVTQEAETTSDEIVGLQRIKALPSIVLAELVYHYFEQEKAEGSIESTEDK